MSIRGESSFVTFLVFLFISPALGGSREASDLDASLQDAFDAAERMRGIGLTLCACRNQAATDSEKKVLSALAEVHFRDGIRRTREFKDRVDRGEYEETPKKRKRDALVYGYLLHVLLHHDLARVSSGTTRNRRLAKTTLLLEEYIWEFDEEAEYRIPLLRARALQGRCAFEQEKFKEALERFEQVIEMPRPNAADERKWREVKASARIFKTHALYKTGRYAEVVSEVAETLSIYQTLPEFHRATLLALGKKASTKTANPSDDLEPIVILSTTQGRIHLKFFPDVAPKHVINFLHHSRSGFYKNTYFHRVFPKFMIQGGDPNTKDEDRSNDGKGGYSYRGPGTFLHPEFNRISHLRGILSMARSVKPTSAGSQFFIMVADNRNLDWKYTVFGKVITGMDVVDQIVAQPGVPIPGAGGYNPHRPQRIEKVTIQYWTADKVRKMEKGRSKVK